MPCLDCKFYVPDTSSYRYSTNSKDEVSGECKVLPPQVLGDSDGDYVESVWPEVKVDDFCSLWQKG